MGFNRVKIFIGVFILLIYISIGVFGLLQLNHTSHSAEAPMINCPYATGGYSICENTLSHIENWQQFSNVIFPSLLIFPLLILGVILYLFGKQNFLNQNQYFYKWKYYLDNKKLYSRKQEIIKWLALFENSPSLLYVRRN